MLDANLQDRRSVAEAATTEIDVLIVGAGLSGIGAGYHLQARCPKLSYAILEARESIGGTWDLFRYPGVRSDSDMYTLGYAFRPWTDAKAIADGPSILRYVRDAADENGITAHIRFNHRVRSASWSSSNARWMVEVERTDTGETVRIAARFLMMCSGYYSYAEGHAPDFPGVDQFKGCIVHPQFWPEDLDYADKKVVVIGSGATAVTLVPELAKKAKHVTMLQRSPSYVVSRPSSDTVADWLRRRLPAKLAYRLTRIKNVAITMYLFRLARTKPEYTKQQIAALTQSALGPDYDVKTHFTPTYNPWDQRMCLVPDADLFDAIRKGTASVATDHIESFTEGGLRLRSGAELPADIVVSATGLKLNLLGDVKFHIDGQVIDLSKAFSYKGMMFSGVPNLAYVFGYSNASWTLKADLACEFLCRLLKHMGRRGYAAATPPLRDPSMDEQPLLSFSSGYVQRALNIMPKQGTKRPWKLNQNYFHDIAALRYGAIEDGVLTFTRQRKS
jgi:monooxygenase